MCLSDWSSDVCSSDLCHRQSRLLHERLQNRYPRQIPRPPLRRPRRSRSAHRRLLPPPPTHHPRCPRPRRRPHLLRVDSPPPPRRRNPSLAISERQQVQRPTEVPSRTVRHLPLHHLLQTPVPPRRHPPRPPPRPPCPPPTQGPNPGSAPPPPPARPPPPRPPPRPRCPRQTQGRSRGSAHPRTRPHPRNLSPIPKSLTPNHFPPNWLRSTKSLRPTPIGAPKPQPRSRSQPPSTCQWRLRSESLAWRALRQFPPTSLSRAGLTLGPAWRPKIKFAPKLSYSHWNGDFSVSCRDAARASPARPTRRQPPAEARPRRVPGRRRGVHQEDSRVHNRNILQLAAHRLPACLEDRADS